MQVAVGLVVPLLVLLALAAPVALYLLVRGEHDQRETMDREQAERAARRDTGERDSNRDKR